MGNLKVAINGFGRIGRMALRRLILHDVIDVVAINDLTDPATLVHLFKYDTAHGVFKGQITLNDKEITLDNKKINIYAEKDPAKLPWAKLGVDLVIESSGHFTTKEDASKHLKAGAKKVVISAPGKGEDIKTIVLGVNDHTLTKEDNLVSNASCTTNCLAPLVKVLDDEWGIEKGFVTTTHAYTSDQSLQDRPHKDLRRARAAAQNIIPTSTGAAKAVGLVLPHLKGKLQAIAMRVPVIDGSVTELNCILKKNTDIALINKMFKKYADGSLKDILEYTEESIVSSDIIGNAHSCIFDAQLTHAMDNFVKVVGWYDNEAGYASRLVDLILKIKNL